MTWILAVDEQPAGLGPDDRRRLAGGKAADLAIMAADLGLPVPPAFTVTTAACRAFLGRGWPDGLDEELDEHLARLEARAGRRLGDPTDPLLVSVRSGAPVSMPGMLDTILDLGLNAATEAGLAARTGRPDFATDCRRRFETGYRDVVGVDPPADPRAQLRGAIEAVFRSWDGERARAYRAREGIPDDLGTGVTVQAMVFGNLGPDSGTGVCFTRDPATGDPELYGDVLFDAQGEDVVAGRHRTEPLAALDERLPTVARELRSAARRLERHHRDLCDIEFTIETGRLWLLQCRVGKRSPQAALRIAIDMAEDPSFPLGRADAVARVAGLLADPPRRIVGRVRAGRPIATGLGASPGLASGAIVTSPDAAVEAADAGRAVILVRSETSPDDVHGMARAAGILTASGGLASHAAVVARGWGIPAVVGATTVRVTATEVVVGGRVLAVGDPITIDGSSGEVFAGVAAGTTEPMPEVATLLAWARELGIPVGAGGAARDAGVTADGAGPAGDDAGPGAAAATDDAVLVALAIKGYALPDAVALAVGCPPAVAAAAIERLVASGHVEAAAGSFRPTAAGREAAAERFAADRAAWGPSSADAALDSFVALDHRMKATVTAWQMREVDGAPVVNDHADAAYDAAVLGDLGALAADADAWLGSLSAGPARMATYRARLARANAAAQAGDPRFVASPRVDSYHGAWFELHEDLIRLAGRSRSDEVAAGRA